jgi:tRNA-binding EMAP/Myf-like protein
MSRPLISAIHADINVGSEEQFVQALVTLKAIDAQKPLGAAQINVYWDAKQYNFRGVKDTGEMMFVVNDKNISRGKMSMVVIEPQGRNTICFPVILLEPKSEQGNRGEMIVEIVAAAEAFTFTNLTGSMSLTKRLSSSEDRPELLELSQNIPNPFNPSTTIHYTIPQSMNVTLVIYSSHGQKIKTLVEGIMQPGSYNTKWNGTNESGEPVASGVYFYTLTSGHSQISKRMTLTR